jgi:hypothetical protein
LNQASDDKKDKQNDDLVSGSSLLVGSLPAMGVASRLFQATQGYVTNPSMSIGGQPPPNLFDPATLFKLMQQLIDQEIQAFLQGLISAAQLEARIAQLVFVTASQLEQRLVQFIGQVDAEINNVVPGLISTATQGISQGLQTVQNIVNSIPGIQNDIAAIKTVLADLAVVQSTLSSLVAWSRSLVPSSGGGYKGGGDVRTNR